MGGYAQLVMEVDPLLLDIDRAQQLQSRGRGAAYGDRAASPSRCLVDWRRGSADLRMVVWDLSGRYTDQSAYQGVQKQYVPDVVALIFFSYWTLS